MLRKGMFLADRYEILEQIGNGGMSDVYKAKCHKLNRYVAIKVLKPEFSQDTSFVSKFRVEAQSAAGLSHPNVVNVYDVGEENGIHYIVMELVEGITLKKYIEKRGKLPYKEAVSIAIQVANGMEAAHKHHIVHRDIKPQNIIISKEGKVKVTDFGIARAVDSNTVSSSAMGSVHYVSPEQARGGYCDAKSDIYSVGITMYEMITGRVPFDGDSTVTVAMKHLQENITPPSQYAPDMSKALEKIILKCTQKSPERRYESTTVLIQDLKRALVDPSGSFVKIDRPYNLDETVMFTDEDMGRLKHGREEYGEYDDDEDDYDEDSDYDDEYEDDEEESSAHRGKRKGKSDEVNPQMNKMMKILTIVAAAVVILIIVLVAGKATGIFRFGSSTGIESNSDSANIEVPQLVGETEAVANEMCEKKNLVMKVVSQKQSDKPVGTVLEQNIKAGEKVKKQTVIEVVVCSGAEEVEVPDVSGNTQDDAWKILKDKGFTDYEVQTEYSDEYDNGEVIRTTPEAGTTATVDTKIVIVVSKGAEKAEVPNLVGMTASQAKEALSAKGLTDGGSTEEYSNTVEEGKIIRQDVKAGKKVDSGTSVSYVVSKGKKPAATVAVPDLRGYSLADAISALRNRGLDYKEERADSPSPSGTVVDMSPDIGSQVEVGSIITLYVSNGSGANNSDSGTE